MKSNIVYRNIKPVYFMNSTGDVIDIRTGECVKINKKNLNIRLENHSGDFTYVKVTSLYATTLLGSRSLENKNIASNFYRKKFI